MGMNLLAGRWGGVWRGELGECRTPDLPWILRKKQLELVEAKHARQAEALRQVRAEPGTQWERRLGVWVGPGQAPDGGEG